MVSGAVIIGRSIGTIGNRMIRPFNMLDFGDLVNKCSLGLVYENPVEVAYPDSLEDKSGNVAYCEGVLINVFGGNDDEDAFREYVGLRLVTAAKIAGKKYFEYVQYKKTRPWTSDLDSQKVCSEHANAPKDGNFFVFSNGIFYVPHMKILETYSHEDSICRYSNIAGNLLRRTREARVKNYIALQDWKLERDLDRVSMVR